uniref:Transcriptional coactivator p15 (PC4) C-terminal domain-containing protein n=1 Tax=Clastoptera arizonana TaxID=38151 RepID=A0A1B6C6N4_9HEMI
MPKEKHTKKRRDSDTSDSGPDPEPKSKPGVKKPKLEKDDINSWHLEGMRYAKVINFRGKPMVDIREFYEADGELKPGRKGICLSASQWRKLEGLTSEIDEALKKA